MAGPEERGGRVSGGSGEAQAQGQPRDSAMAPMQPSLGPPRDEPRVFGLDKFNGDNFAEWSFKMENIFDHYDLLEVMEGTEKRPENDPEKSPWVRKSAQGYLLLGQALGSSQIRHIKPFQREPEKGPKAWAALKGVHAPATAAVAVVLERQMAALRIEEDEAVEEGVQKFFDLLTRLEGADLNYSELQKKTKLLAFLPESWSSHVINLNRDLPRLSLEDVKRAILQEDFRRRELASADGAGAASIGRGYGRGRGKGRGTNSVEVAGVVDTAMTTRTTDAVADGSTASVIFSTRADTCGAIATKSLMDGLLLKAKKVEEQEEGEEEAVEAVAVAEVVLQKDEGFEEPAAVGKVTLHSLDYWVIDSGATYSMTPRADLLTELEPSPVKHVTSALGQRAEVKGMGKAISLWSPCLRRVAASISTKGEAVGSGDGANGRAKEIKSKKFNLGGTSKPGEHEKSGAAAQKQHKGEENPKAAAEEEYGENMWGTIASAAFSNPTSATGECDWLTLHRRMGHVALPILQQLVKNEMVAGIRVKGEPDEVVMDVVGPLKLGAAGAEYFLTIVDVYTRMTWVYVLSKKSDVAETVKTDWLPMVERQQDRLVKAIRTDRGGEFLSKEFSLWLKKNGIRHSLTMPYSPAMNGIAERANRTITETARGLLIEAGLPDYFWPDAVRSACVAKNRALTHVGVDKWVPYVDWIGRKPKVDMLRVFGCMCMALVPKHLRHNKLGAKARSLSAHRAEVTRWARGRGTNKPSERAATASNVPSYRTIPSRNTQLVKNEMVAGIRVKGEPDEVLGCPTCMQAKFTRYPFSSSEAMAKAPLDEVVMDVVGPLKLGAAGAEYFLTIVDVYTRMTWVYVLSKKSDVAETVKTDWLPMVERQQDRLVKAIRTVRGGEFLSKDFSLWLKKYGIRNSLTMPYSPAMNGIAE
ncbi:unnamed protein product [Closterium sp. NIES-54]